MKVLLLAVMVTVALAHIEDDDSSYDYGSDEDVSDDDELEWYKFKIKFHRHYKTEEEQIVRKSYFMKSLKAVREQNAMYKAGLSSWIAGINDFSDWSPYERKHHSGPGDDGLGG